MTSAFAKRAFQEFRTAARDIADGADSVPAQMFRSVTPYKQQRLHRQRPYTLLIISPSDQSGTVRLFEITAQLGKNLVKTDAHRYRDADFTFNAFTNDVGKLRRGSLKVAQ